MPARSRHSPCKPCKGEHKVLDSWAKNIARTGRSGDAYRLSDLQQYIVHFPSSHYSQNGKEPLLYATVLVLSLQFKAAISFLAKDATTSSYRVDAPHFAIALHHHQVIPDCRPRDFPCVPFKVSSSR